MGPLVEILGDTADSSCPVSVSLLRCVSLGDNSAAAVVPLLLHLKLQAADAAAAVLGAKGEYLLPASIQLAAAAAATAATAAATTAAEKVSDADAERQADAVAAPAAAAAAVSDGCCCCCLGLQEGEGDRRHFIGGPNGTEAGGASRYCYQSERRIIR